jgi:hypothetical protein
MSVRALISYCCFAVCSNSCISGEIFLMSVIQKGGGFGEFSGLAFCCWSSLSLPVELCRNWKWKFGWASVHLLWWLVSLSVSSYVDHLRLCHTLVQSLFNSFGMGMHCLGYDIGIVGKKYVCCIWAGKLPGTEYIVFCVLLGKLIL